MDCLHKKEGCWRARALAFSSYEHISADPPPAASYSTVCKHCWPSGDPEFDAVEDLGSSDDDTDNSIAKDSATEEDLSDS